MSGSASVKVTSYLPQVLSLIDVKVNVGLNLAAEHLLGAAEPLVPHADTGNLSASGVVYQEKSMEWGVAYGGSNRDGADPSEYALVQYFNEKLSHPDPKNPKSRPGTEARWLEVAAEQEKGRMFEIVKEAVT